MARLDEKGMATLGGMLAETLDKRDEVRALSDAELAERLLNGSWTTIEVHEAGRRLAEPKETPDHA